MTTSHAQVRPPRTRPQPEPARSAGPASRDAKPVPVAGSAKTGGDPLKVSGQKPDAPLAEPPAKQDPPTAG